MKETLFGLSLKMKRWTSLDEYTFLSTNLIKKAAISRLFY
jgi:hypothetical protein